MGSVDGISFYTFFKGVKVKFGVAVGRSVGLGFDRGFDATVDIADEITFVIDNRYDLGFSNRFSYALSDENLWVCC